MKLIFCGIFLGRYFSVMLEGSFCKNQNCKSLHRIVLPTTYSHTTNNTLAKRKWGCDWSMYRVTWHRGNITWSLSTVIGHIVSCDLVWWIMRWQYFHFLVICVIHWCVMSIIRHHSTLIGIFRRCGWIDYFFETFLC